VDGLLLIDWASDLHYLQKHRKLMYLGLANAFG